MFAVFRNRNIKNNKNMKRIKLIGGFILTLLLLVAPVAVLAGGENESDSVFSFSSMLDIISFAFVIIALVVVLKLVLSYGESAIGVSLIYFLIGTFFLGMVRVFLFLTDSGRISVSEITVQIGWHLFHYCSTIAFFVASRILLGYTKGVQTKPSYLKAKMACAGSVIFIAGAFLVVIFFDGFIRKFEGTFLDRAGLVHFISFALSIAIAFYLLKVKSKLIPAIAVIVSPLLVSVALFGISHFWELLTESWKVINLESSVIEQVEQYITFPAYILVAYAFWRSMSLLKSALG